MKSLKEFSFCLISSKGKLERIEILVICHHNEHEFKANHLKYFLNLKTLYIAESSFQKLSDKIPRLENLEVS